MWPPSSASGIKNPHSHDIWTAWNPIYHSHGTQFYTAETRLDNNRLPACKSSMLLNQFWGLKIQVPRRDELKYKWLWRFEFIEKCWRGYTVGPDQYNDNIDYVFTRKLTHYGWMHYWLVIILFILQRLPHMLLLFNSTLWGTADNCNMKP